ncbi:XRE family transcriptional regulator [Pseudonocardia charpentierae]|uniref:XRE family transcriptional regulator n=1 Tax=Pseudonocardia charpentierae TaxID=3075545 RepID=A0ABU2NAP1_9PSEU|nr:XRE family transcriptional regulator [Pseudonocardia sp. DSM 45834]MDT0351021.1 XRE family transcriptional regulator [Pseudonocardia sp. DSM 45834]
MPPVHDAPDAGAAALRHRIARNRGRQRELYGAPLGDRLRRLTGELGITQCRLAQTLGLSPAMLSQLASARRVKIGDPAVLARLQLLDRRCAAGPPRGRVAVDALLAEVAGAQLQWTGADGPGAAPEIARRPATGPHSAARSTPADALRAVASPARLAAAAAALAPAFPELARVLRQAAAHPRGTAAARLRRG